MSHRISRSSVYGGVQASRLVATPGWKRGSMKAALTEAVIKVAQLILQPDAAAELAALSDGSLGAPSQQKAL